VTRQKELNEIVPRQRRIPAKESAFGKSSGIEPAPDVKMVQVDLDN